MNPTKILFKNYITDREWETGVILSGKTPGSIDELTREFRVKSSKLCEDVLAYLRAHLLLNYKGNDIVKILVTIPTSLNYEEFVLDYATSLFIEIKNQYKTTVYEDEMLLKDPKLDIRKRFATILRLGHKRIADEQIKLLKILLYIIANLRAGLDFKSAYMVKNPEFDKTEEDHFNSRKKLSNYLRLLNHNYSV